MELPIDTSNDVQHEVPATEKMHKVINKIRSSSPASDALRKAQMDKDPAMTPLQLILDIEIRWTTLPSMIKRQNSD
ncbi:unnamed protein product [Trichogramma brassicae]|uniref:Uncharacterized protein n=1 Tax=Trichogramma brassicae TaxID=86971 RepID=A0A6H5J451_9HYME|nr:unnamed protein product [Trichogramma brassicae]